MTERYKQLQSELTMDLFSSFTLADYTFVKTLLFARQNLDETEYKLFQKLYTVLSQNFPTPDLLVYFHRQVDVLQENIQKRGRVYEAKISDQYLLKVQNSYFEYFRNILSIPVVIIDLGRMDFVHNPQHYEEIKTLLNRRYQPGVHRISPII